MFSTGIHGDAKITNVGYHFISIVGSAVWAFAAVYRANNGIGKTLLIFADFMGVIMSVSSPVNTSIRSLN